MKSWSLKSKLLLTSSSTLLLVVIISVSWAIYTFSNGQSNISQIAKNNFQQESHQKFQLLAQSTAQKIESTFEEAYTVARTLANTLNKSIVDKDAFHLQREQVRLLNEQLLKNLPAASAIYSQFEPNAYDGQDYKYTDGFKHSTPQGTFDIYWVRNDDGTFVHYRTEDPSVKYLDSINATNGYREAEWYLCPLETAKPCVIEPYLFEITKDVNILMTTMAQPVVVNGQSVGMVGVDFNLSVLQKLAKELSFSIYNGQGDVHIISADGLIAASSKDKKIISKQLKKVDNSLYQQWVNNQASLFVDVDNENIVVGSPIRIESAGVTWTVLLSIPESLAMAPLINMEQNISKLSDDLIWGLIVVGVVLLLLATGLMIVMLQSISRPIAEINDNIKELATNDGDLTKHLDIQNHQELISISNNFNLFIDKLRGMIITVKHVGHNLYNIADGNKINAEEAEKFTLQQSSDVNTILTALHELTAAANEVSRLAQGVSSSSDQTSQLVHDSKKELDVLVREVKNLDGNMNKASTAIQSVSEQSNNISVILDTIRNIAEQTNLLALNAAIEAARAGEQGRGFAVVADEVRNLASQTQESTTEIGELISALQQQVQDSVAVIKSSAENVTSTVDCTTSVYTSLDQVVSQINNINEHASQVATASEQQCAVTEDLHGNMNSISSESDHLSEIAQNSIEGAKQLQEMANELELQLNLLKV